MPKSIRLRLKRPQKLHRPKLLRLKPPLSLQRFPHRPPKKLQPSRLPSQRWASWRELSCSAKMPFLQNKRTLMKRSNSSRSSRIPLCKLNKLPARKPLKLSHVLSKQLLMKWPSRSLSRHLQAMRHPVLWPKWSPSRQSMDLNLKKILSRRLTKMRMRTMKLPQRLNKSAIVAGVTCSTKSTWCLKFLKSNKNRIWMPLITYQQENLSTKSLV